MRVILGVVRLGGFCIPRAGVVCLYQLCSQWQCEELCFE